MKTVLNPEMINGRMELLRFIPHIMSILWITTCSSAPIDTRETKVPDIGECVYKNAYYVDCWWQRPTGDDSTQYRLGYFSAADSYETRQEKFCDVTEKTTEGDVTIEHCGIQGSMYGRFTLFVAIVRDCSEDVCTIVAKSAEVDFTCMSNNVKLTLPPTSLDIDPTTQKLSWHSPEREDSMLSFVLHRRHVLYRVEFREILEENKNSDWMEWYTGYKTSVFLPTLIPGATYEVRVYASLDPPFSRFTVTSEPQMADRDWTPPSNVLVFLVPKPMTMQAFKKIDLDRENVEEQTTASNVIENVVRPIHVSQRIIIASSVATFVIVLVLAVAGYFLPWKKWCCCLNDVKYAKPKLMLDFEDCGKAIPDLTPTSMIKSTTSENFQPITQMLNFESESTASTRVVHHNKVTTRYHISRINTKSGPDCGRQRLLSPTPSTPSKEDSFSLNDLLDREGSIEGSTSSKDDVRHSSDVIGKNACRKIQWGKSLSTHEVDGLLSHAGDMGENTPVRYVKFQQSEVTNMTSQDELPSYILTKEQEEADTSYDKLSCDYVVDDTGIGSVFTNDLSDVTDMTSYDEEEEKEKQWQRYMMTANHSENADGEDIPDYVMHAPTLPKDFCRNMTLFVSMATEDVSKRRPLNVYDVTKDSLLEEKKVDAGKLRHSDASSSRIIVMTMCPSCNSTQEHECCPQQAYKNSTEDFLAMPVLNNRRGSVSDHSVDSGYSPDSPDCGMATSIVKADLLGSRFELGSRGDVRSVEDESDNDEYMKYVTS